MVVRVRGVEHAKQMREELREDERGSRAVAVPEVSAPTGAGAAGVVAEGGDRIELDLSSFGTAVADLDRLHGVLTELLTRAEREMDQPLGDGKGPVARNMRHAFGLRGSDLGGGVRAALRSYLSELTELREALQQVGATQQAQDHHIAEALGRLR
ncbi:hypothetical protein B0I31_11047 [Saccharothrix carnea]|uniref:Excreted virulence factor EspC (Type VII ESX diderm) n=1 Tax=Saccharothrix carnea TaxID=1280637 RepID=A0A2P8I3B9_SACCR|nr:hypothetical protein [Saccharothrix carnea]PSL52956.1 hypothetical protein B0I31_11047 [Saccharothrix carnea]